MNGKEPIGERLRVARIRAGLSLRDAARELAMPPRAISDIEHQRTTPNEKLANDMLALYVDSTPGAR